MLKGSIWRYAGKHNQPILVKVRGNYVFVVRDEDKMYPEDPEAELNEILDPAGVPQ